MNVADENTPLLQEAGSILVQHARPSSGSSPSDTSVSDEPDKPDVLSSRIYQVVPVLLIGVFVANIDTSLIIASSQRIASEFEALSDASWLITSYGLALCASQPLYGKLSNIFGRKSNLVISYAIFAIGCLLCGVGSTFWHIILGRAISGIGAAGMTALVSIVIADMLPSRQVAAWRSYVNVIATAARSLGPPLGGLIVDAIGWRMTFLIQCPVVVGGLLLVAWRFPNHTDAQEETEESSWKQKFSRIDYLGSIMLTVTIIALLLTMEFTGKDRPWWQISITAVICVIAFILFYFIERKHAKEPIFPIYLLTNRDVATTYIISLAQQAAQFGIFYAATILFQVAMMASVSQTGLQMLPAAVGNAFGGICAGLLISRTGRYKTLTIMGCIVAMIGYTLIWIRWSDSMQMVEVLYLFPGGFGTGIILSTTFVHLTATLDREEMAMAGSMLYCVQTMGLLVGIQIMTTVLHSELRIMLNEALKGFEHRKSIIQSAISDIDVIWQMPKDIRDIVAASYIDALRYTYASSLALSAVAFLSSVALREKKL